MFLSARNSRVTADKLRPLGLLDAAARSTWSTTCWRCAYQQRVDQTRAASSGSRWKQRQSRDPFTREAKVQGLKSRAAFKLLEMDQKYKLFKRGQTVLDLGYAPGSWSQVAVERTRPNGRVIGIDLIPAQPPRGVATFQGDFCSPVVQQMVKNFIVEAQESTPVLEEAYDLGASSDASDSLTADRPSYIDMERHAASHQEQSTESPDSKSSKSPYIVDLVLSDMSAPWQQTAGFYTNTLSNPYSRLMNTSGNTFRDHAGSMDLCGAALDFASETLRPGGHFVCKFYQGAEDKALEQRLRKLFAKVYREKPESSRSDSKEAYFVALKRKGGVIKG